MSTRLESYKGAEITKALLRAASSPIRVQAYSIVAEGMASPKEIAEQLGISDISNVSYHLRELAKLGLIAVARTEKRRGATEHFYRSLQRPLVEESEWREFSVKERENFTTWAVQLILMDVAQSLTVGAFDERDDRHLTRTPLQVDEEGWRELVQIHLEAFSRSLDVQARSDERRSQSGEQSFPVYSTLMLFEAGR
jgi:DNA-binding transcriptional ArsR family regulator